MADDTNPVLLDFGTRAWWVFADHTVVPAIRGGDGSGDGGEGGDGSGDEGTPPSGGDRKITQDDLGRVGAAEAAKGKRAGAKETLEALGFSSMEEAKAFFDKQRENENNELTEAQRLLKAAEEKERKANERIAAANARELNARIERALESEGVDAKSSPKVRRLVEDIDVDATDDEINVAVAALKEEMPHLFGKTSDSTPPPPGVPPKPPAGGGNSGDTKSKANDLLRQRHPQIVRN